MIERQDARENAYLEFIVQAIRRPCSEVTDLKPITTFTQVAILAALLCFSGTGSAHAGLITVDMGKTLQDTQTDAAGDMSLDGYYFGGAGTFGHTRAVAAWHMIFD